MSTSTEKPTETPQTSEDAQVNARSCDPLQYRFGNIVKEVTSGVILQGVNCSNAMGSGLAFDILMKYPMVKEVFHKVEPVLGYICPVKTSQEGLTIVNGYTQQSYGRERGVVYASEDAIREVLQRTIDFCIRKGIKDMHTVYMGSGLGGIPRWKIENIFKEIGRFLLTCPEAPTLYIWDNQK